MTERAISLEQAAHLEQATNLEQIDGVEVEPHEASPELEDLAEWHRIELLCLCLLSAAEGPSDDLLSELKRAQSKVNQVRASTYWHALPLTRDPSMSAQEIALTQDIIACVFAPHVLPRVGWLYQDLQSDKTPAPSEALILSVLAIPDALLHLTRKVIARLEAAGYIKRDQATPFSPLFPDRLLLSGLMKWSLDEAAPPGSYSVKRRARWDELILPSAQKAMLREYLYWIQQKHRVVGEWGGQATGGPVALFAGPSGTGKTMAASVLAKELNWPLFRVDLAALVSKYVGETEKNIGQLFDATHGRKIILQFDEVDALMGKRGELREAKDRYANMEVSYLLARIEEHEGPCVLTTNLRSQIDKAFCRRFQMVVEFPRPGVEQRVTLWKQLLPPRAPLAPDLDFVILAKAINFTGGQIRNAALHAAYLAAANHSEIGWQCIAVAVHRELAKEQSQVSLSQMGVLAQYLGQALD